MRKYALKFLLFYPKCQQFLTITKYTNFFRSRPRVANARSGHYPIIHQYSNQNITIVNAQSITETLTIHTL